MFWLYDKIYYLQVVRLPAIMGRLPAIVVVSVTKCIILSSFIIQVVGIVVVELVTCCGISTNFGVQVWNFQSGEHRRLLTNNTYHSFIHYEDLYSAPSRLLLRSAPDPCTAKKKSFETRVECVRKNPGEQSLRQRKPIPHRGTNHRECTGLGCGCTSERNKE